MNWIRVEDEELDFSNCSFILTEDKKVKPFRNEVGIFEHCEVLYDILNCTHWMKKPQPPEG